MGSLSYDRTVVEFDDRLLAHLQVVIVQKFRAGDHFLMSWLDPAGSEWGRSALWLSPDAPMHFKFAGSRAPEIDPDWLALLQHSADTGQGLIVRNAHNELTRATSQHELARAY